MLLILFDDNTSVFNRVYIGGVMSLMIEGLLLEKALMA